jgi:hypothetical protein
LPVRVRVLALEGNLGAILGMAEYNFGHVGSQVWAAEGIVVDHEGHQHWFSVDDAELMKNFDLSHASVPTMAVGDVGDLEGVVGAGIELG